MNLSLEIWKKITIKWRMVNENIVLKFYRTLNIKIKIIRMEIGKIKIKLKWKNIGTLNSIYNLYFDFQCSNSIDFLIISNH